MRRPLQPWPIRLTHWVNAALLVVLAGSGLRIFDAYPGLGPKGAPYRWYPWQGHPVPDALTLGGWLAGGRAWHFAFAWIFQLNALGYLLYLGLSGEWRRRLFSPRRDARHAVRTFLHYLRLGPEPPPAGLYNGLQRLAYTSSLAFAAFSVLSGLTLLVPVQLGLLTRLWGFDGARVLHLAMLACLAGFTIGHVVMVAAHPRTFPTMITGGPRPPPLPPPTNMSAKGPESRNG